MKKVFFITILCGSVLAACGGGGGGGGDNSTANNSPASAQVGPPVALSTENYEPAAREIVGSVSSLQSTGTAAQSFLTGVEVMSSMSSPAMLLQEKLPELAQLLKRGTHLTGAQYTEAIACPAGGKMDVIANDNNNNEELDAGDNVDLTLTSCQYGGLKITGKMGFRINSGTAFSNMTAASINISATINDYKAEFNDTVSIGDGSFTMNIAQAYLAALSGPAVSVDIQTPLMTTQVTQADTTKVFQLKNYTVNAIVSSTFTSWSVNGNVSVPTLGANTADIQTITRFTPAAATNYAAGGALLITVRDGGKMRVTATGTANAKVELDLNSDGIYETFKLVPWIDVL